MSKHQTKGRLAGSRGNSRSNSRTNSPCGSDTIENDECDEMWVCKICEKQFRDPNAKMLECQRCKEHYCIKCLKKTDNEYKIITASDIMWFCGKCREKVEKNIIIDVDIETRCRQIMENYESRITKLETEISAKCSVEQVKEIVKNEIKTIPDKQSCSIEQVREVVKDELDVNAPAEGDASKIINEIEQRKIRANNIIIHGSTEKISANADERYEHDVEIVTTVLNKCEITHQPRDIEKVIRIGRFDKDKAKRPIIATLSNPEMKRSLLRNLKCLRESEGEIKDYRVTNDLTKTEREYEKKLFSEAKELEKNTPGEYKFVIRGPPWDRKIVKMKKNM